MIATISTNERRKKNHCHHMRAFCLFYDYRLHVFDTRAIHIFVRVKELVLWNNFPLSAFYSMRGSPIKTK